MKRSSGFRHFFSVAFLLFLAPAGDSNPAEQLWTFTLPNLSKATVKIRWNPLLRFLSMIQNLFMLDKISRKKRKCVHVININMAEYFIEYCIGSINEKVSRSTDLLYRCIYGQVYTFIPFSSASKLFSAIWLC